MNIKTLDLFCGAGGSSYGAAMAGAEIIRGVDLWEEALKTYSAIFKDGKGRDLGKKLEMTPDTVPAELGLRRGDIDLLLASPECTNHTCARGNRALNEESRGTASYVVNFAQHLRPEWLVIENVVQMRAWPGYSDLLNRLKAMKYGICEQVLDAAKFGVPQTRRRLIITARKGNPPPPVVAPSLPEIPVRDILDHDFRTGKDKYNSRELHIPTRALPTIGRFETGFNALGRKRKPFLIVYYGSDAAGGWQSLDRPLRTLTTLDRFGLVTWKGRTAYLRMLQVPEICRAMGWPDDIEPKFSGTRRDKIKQLGNGVCPPVMKHVVEQLTSKG